jgi:hypothetical protein
MYSCWLVGVVVYGAIFGNGSLDFSKDGGAPPDPVPNHMLQGMLEY